MTSSRDARVPSRKIDRPPKRSLSDAGIDADEGRPTEDEDKEGIRQALEELAKQDAEMGISLVEKVEAEVCK